MASQRKWLIHEFKGANGGAMERYDFRTQRLFVEHALAKGVRIPANRSQANYLLNVLRMNAGDAVLLFNGKEGEWLAHIEPSGRKSYDLVAEKQTRPQPGLSDLLYCFAPLKQGRLDYMVQKAVEMGAGALQPVITQHTQVSRLNMERLRANIIEAAEQCGILSIPVVHDVVKFADLLGGWPQQKSLIFCDEGATERDPAKSLAQLRGKSLALIIGPEGGFSTEERETLRQKPFVTPISLGPRILRADTAAVAALAAIQLLAGDWRD